MSRPGIIVQARMGSSRLPGKVLMPLREQPILYHLWQRMKRCHLVNLTAIATTTRKEDDDIIAWAAKYSIFVFRGSEDNVWERYVMTARALDLDPVIRVTGDNPLTSPEIIDKLLDVYSRGKYDYVSMGGLPIGITSEVVSRSSLESLAKYPLSPEHFEHVTLFIKENPSLFKTLILPPPAELACPDLRFTVDMPEDYYFLQKIFEVFYTPGKLIPLQKVIRWLYENPEYALINAAVEQRNPASPFFYPGWEKEKTIASAPVILKLANEKKLPIPESKG